MTLNSPPRRKRMIGREDRPKSEKVRKKKKMMILKRKMKMKMNKSGKIQERGNILVRHTNLNQRHREDLPQVTSEVNSKPRLQMKG
jgi:hypothetical protein